MISTVVTIIAELFGSVRALFGDVDWEAGRVLAHGVKGVAGNLGADKLFEAAVQLEKSLKEAKVGDLEAGLEVFSSRI